MLATSFENLTDVWDVRQKKRSADDLKMYARVIQQRKNDKDKIYSLHKPFTCIAKGKAHMPYEFGDKIGLMVNPKNLVVLAIESFAVNPHDSNTIEPFLNQTPREKFRRRAAIERVIGHLKQQFRMGPNYHHGNNSFKINALLAATVWNFRKLMEKLKNEFSNFLFFNPAKNLHESIPNFKKNY